MGIFVKNFMPYSYITTLSFKLDTDLESLQSSISTLIPKIFGLRKFCSPNSTTQKLLESKNSSNGTLFGITAHRHTSLSRNLNNRHIYKLNMFGTLLQITKKIPKGSLKIIEQR